MFSEEIFSAIRYYLVSPQWLFDFCKTPQLSRRANFLRKGEACETTFLSSGDDGGARSRQQ